jgi:hypothetical protein
MNRSTGSVMRSALHRAGTAAGLCALLTDVERSHSVRVSPAGRGFGFEIYDVKVEDGAAVGAPVNLTNSTATTSMRLEPGDATHCFRVKPWRNSTPTSCHSTVRTC